MRNRFDRQLEQLNNELINNGKPDREAIEMAINRADEAGCKESKGNCGLR